MAKSRILLIVALAIASFPPAIAAQVSGTAFAVAPGLLVTNQHVIADCRSIEAVVADARRSGSIVDADKQIDLALLRVSGLTGETARLRRGGNIRLGEAVYVFGFPLVGALSSSGNFTSGLVSALRGLNDAPGALQITAPVQPGNSGGPLIDNSGLVIGVVRAKLDAIRAAMATGDIPQNVNFAISREVLVQFLRKNKVSFTDAPQSRPLDTERLAELAQSFTYQVVCNPQSRPQTPAPVVRRSPNPSQPEVTKHSRADSELLRSRADVIQKIKDTRAGAEKILALHEAERKRAEEKYEQLKDRYYKGLATRNDVLEAENALFQAMARIDEDKRWIEETDKAMAEVLERDQVLRPDQGK